MSTRISQLPPYVGPNNPVGDLPISIAGTTYRISPQQITGAYVDYYVGTFGSRLALESSIGIPYAGYFGFVVNVIGPVKELAQYNGTTWDYTNLLSTGGATPLANLEVRVFKKAAGNSGGFTKETGDWVMGEPVAGTFWSWAIVGSDPGDYNTYQVLIENSIT